MRTAPNSQHFYKEGKDQYFYYVALILMASTFLPLVFNNLPPVIRSQHFYAIIWIASLLLFRPSFFTTKGIIYILSFALFLYLSILTIWQNMDDWNKQSLFDEYYQIAIGLSIFTYFKNNKDFISIAKITKWSIIFIFITSIMTIISSAIDPMYARNFSAKSVVSASEYEDILSFKRYGGGAYSTAGAFMSLFPALVYYYKNTNLSLLSKKQIIIFSIFIFSALLGMQIYGNILIAFTFGIIAFLGTKNLNKTFFISIFIFTIFIAMPKQVYVNSLFTIGNFFEKNSELNFKITDTARFLETGVDFEDKSTATASRAGRYPMLFDSFEKSPILGCYFLSSKSGNGYNSEGVHLHWMNKLTVTGIIGLMLFSLIPFYFIKNCIRGFNSTYKFYYLLASLSILSYGLIKTIAGRETWYVFFVILPGMYYLPLLKSNTKNTKLKRLSSVVISEQKTEK
jgi:hypothetical protein